MSDTERRAARTLLWEVGCEELPAWACDAIERQVGALVRDALIETGLAVDGADPVVWVGPRRFSVLIEALAERAAVQETLNGPPVKIAFEGGDATAAPTQAGAGFARKCGVEPSELQVDAAKGIVFVERAVPSAPIEELWPAQAEAILGKLQFAKPMRWGSSPWRFVRPIRWMVTMHDERVIAYDCWGVTSGRTTRTHRFLGDAREAQLATADAYATTLRDAKVIVDHDIRRTMIEQGLASAASELGGEWNDPGNVLKEVVHLVEAPTVITGRFDEKYLELPERVLVTAMQSHQRYLPVQRGGSLAPAFLTVMNASPAAVETILPGYERVLAGRLDDAVFSFERDRARGLDDMATDESLGAVVFHADAGSLADRRDRIAAVAAELASQLGEDAAMVADAARLAKADQVSGVVQEFAELEGFAGSLYAKAIGYDDAVCAAIDQQFLPRGEKSPLPDPGIPALIALADKLELLVTMYSIGEQPTGSRDPHGLRRAAAGIVRIILEHDLQVHLPRALDVAYEAIAKQGYGSPASETLDQLHAFLMDRLEKRLSDDGVRVDAIRAAFAANLPLLQHDEGLARALDLEVKGGNPTFTQVLEAQDRSRKLIEKAGGVADGDVDESAFEVDSERELHRQLGEIEGPLAAAVDERRFGDAVALAAELGPAVESFFSRESGVMVMTDDETLQANRLRLLARVVAVTAPLGDLSQLQV
jgi:glycyl-tRNA synthetase beta chain